MAGSLEVPRRNANYAYLRATCSMPVYPGAIQGCARPAPVGPFMPEKLEPDDEYKILPSRAGDGDSGKTCKKVSWNPSKSVSREAVGSQE